MSLNGYSYKEGILMETDPSNGYSYKEGILMETDPFPAILCQLLNILL